MKLTKKNGTICVYDDEKVVRSILRANGEVDEEQIGRALASAIADQVFDRLAGKSEFLSTVDVRRAVYEILREKGLPQTAEHYMNYQK